MLSALGKSCLTHSEDQMLKPGLSAGTLLKKEKSEKIKKENPDEMPGFIPGFLDQNIKEWVLAIHIF